MNLKRGIDFAAMKDSTRFIGSIKKKEMFHQLNYKFTQQMASVTAITIIWLAPSEAHGFWLAMNCCML